MESTRHIGFRVRAAREAAGRTQDDLAALLGLENRQSVSDLENGKRGVKPDELVILSDAFDRPIDYFVDPFSVAGEAKYNWRVSPEVRDETLDDFENRTNQLVGILRWLRDQTPSDASALKRGLRLSSESMFEAAQARAERLAQELGLGEVPAARLLETIERELDIPVLMVDPGVFGDGSLSGATCHLEDLTCILLNRREGETRRAYTLAHELFHALTWDAMEPERRESNTTDDRGTPSRKRVELLANNFASALLMPRVVLDQLVTEPADVARLRAVAERLRVSTSALAWRLIGLGRIDDEVREALVRRPVTVRQTLPRLYSESFVRALHSALDRGRFSARKVAKTLALDGEQLAALFASYELATPFEF